MNLVFADEAEKNLEDILDSIAEKNPKAASKLVLKLKNTCYDLVEFPYKAPSASLFYGDDIRQLVYKKRFYIFYIIQDEIIFILKITDVKKKPKKLK